MKRLSALLVSLLTVALLSTSAGAAHFWKIQMSDPTTSDQVRTFNIEYTALSTEPDEIVVKLYQDGDEIDSQTTAPGGDSGSFTVTVPEDGTYTYKMSGQVNGEEIETIETDEKVVDVNTPEGEVTVVTVNNTGGGQTGGGGQGAGGGTGNGAGGTDGEVAGAEDQGGQVGEDSPSTTENEETKGANTSNDNSSNWTWVILAVVAALALGYYLIYYRQGKSPFGSKEE